MQFSLIKENHHNNFNSPVMQNLRHIIIFKNKLHAQRQDNATNSKEKNKEQRKKHITDVSDNVNIIKTFF